MSYIVVIDKYFQRVESEGQWSSWQQSLEGFDHVQVWGVNLLPHTQHWSTTILNFLPSKNVFLSVRIPHNAHRQVV